MPFRQLDLVGPENHLAGPRSFTSDYWFQSKNTSTVNYSRRVLSQLRHPDIHWAMVSVLWNEGVPSDVRELFLLDIQQAVSKELNQHG